MTARSSVWLAAGLLIALPASAEPPPLSFKGIEFGSATPADVTAKFAGAEMFSSSVVATQSKYARARCGAFTLATSDCHLNLVRDPLFRIGKTSTGDFYFNILDGVIEGVRATFSSSSFDAVAETLEEKYGPPTARSHEPVQSKAGATFDSRIVTWRLRDGDIRAEERSGKVDAMALTMSTNKLKAHREQEAKKSVKDAVKDL